MKFVRAEQEPDIVMVNLLGQTALYSHYEIAKVIESLLFLEVYKGVFYVQKI